MEPPVLPKPPDETLVDFHAVGRRWNTHSVIAEKTLSQSGVPFFDIPQKPKRGVRLSDLLAFEQQWRENEAARRRGVDKKNTHITEVAHAHS